MDFNVAMSANCYSHIFPVCHFVFRFLTPLSYPYTPTCQAVSPVSPASLLILMPPVHLCPLSHQPCCIYSSPTPSILCLPEFFLLSYVKKNNDNIFHEKSVRNKKKNQYCAGIIGFDAQNFLSLNPRLDVPSPCKRSLRPNL